MPPSNRPPASKVTDQHVQALLTRHACPTPLHVLRMRLLGAIASPRFDVSPIRVVEQAWGGQWPELASEEDDLLRNFQKLAITADEAINRVIQSCKRARAQHIDSLTVVPSRRFTAEEPDEHDLIYSALNQTITRNGVTVEVHIYKDDSTDWILELVDGAGNSHVWDDQFLTDQAAFDEALRALDEEPLEFMEPQPGSSLN